ncbi:TIGR02302 family protein [Aminobacter anthyllidis]|uniref:TIGR02302 family protein n=1 Tax=Aminobacter anthyllidis TaxID=1035067 RepID=A0A9X1ACJ1_9HYPH|nr:TIGR02302 family protein [Aminobacter anthyllidis]MBT1157359.1 TIGR02302 family protein [Aminobacter anthyllidis]
MTEPTRPALHRNIAVSLGRTRLAIATAMVVERGWPLVLPLIVVTSLFVSLSWLGLFRVLPDMARMALAAAFALAGLASIYPLRFFRLPSWAEIDSRLERANQLLHTPVQVQTDRPSGRPDSFSDALWREHQKRMAERLGTLGGDLPQTRVPERDPWALRAAAALLFVCAFAFSFGPIGGRLGDAFRAHAARDAVPPRIDAWVTPPTYTGKAPIFLTADASKDTPVINVPEGSELSLRVTGGAGDETLAFSDATGAVRDIAPMDQKADPAAPVTPGPVATVRQFSEKLVAEGKLTLKSGDNELDSWGFAVTPDNPPKISFAGEPKRAVNGTLELNYNVEDDYGAASAKAGFVLAEDQSPNARPLYGPPEMPLSLPRRGAAKKPTKATRDLTEHVWAGASVKLTLQAVDDAGQEAKSETKTIILPEKPFTNPLARAVIEQRRLLALDANAKPRVLELMDAITLRPEDTIENLSHYLALMSARTRLQMAGSEDQLREEVAYLWQVALGIEEGDLSAAEKRLRQAQQALQDALERGASDEEIDKLMAELRDAMNDFLREFAERNQQNQNAQNQSPAQELRQSDLQRMLDQIENLAKSGNRDQAKELLSQLQDMMNNLQAGKRQQGQQGQQNSEMRQQMDKLGEIMRRQQEMMNETFRMDQMQRGPQGDQQSDPFGDNGEPGQQQDKQGKGQQGKPMTPQEFADALKQLQQGQGQLEKDLEALMKSLEGLGIKPGEGFGDAGESMNQAEGSLGKGEGDRAVGHQGRALEALRKGAQDMMQQMQAMQGDQGGSGEGGRQQNAGRDPLGRPSASDGPDQGDTTTVPDVIDAQRARQILDAIRKRLGNALSPELERSYLERLLELK